MKRSHLIALAVAAAALLVLFLVMQARQGPTSEVPPAWDLLQKPLQLSEIEAIRIRLRPGGEDAQEITLRRLDDRWHAEQQGAGTAPPSAPADSNWVNQLLESLEELDEGGDLRASIPEVHADFHVTDDQGVHLELLESGG